MVRQQIRRFHYLLAMTVGFFLCFAGITGSLLVFDHEIDERLNPGLLTIAHPDLHDRLPYDALYQHAEKYIDTERYYIHGLTARRHEAASQLIWYKAYDVPDTLYELYIHPHTGTVLGKRVWSQYFTSFIYRLHYSLFAGRTGEIILGLMGIGSLILVFTGLYLWIPRGKQKKWRIGFSLKKHAAPARYYIDIHRVCGIYALPLLLIAIITGITLQFPEQTERVRQSLTQDTTADKKLEYIKPSHGKTVDQVINTTQFLFPDSRFSRIYFLPEQEGIVKLTFTHPDQPKKDNGFDRVKVDTRTGEILEYKSWDNAALSHKATDWLFPLHSGEVGGIMYEVIVCLLGIIPSIMFWAGWKFRQQKKVKAKRNNIVANNTLSGNQYR